MMAERIRGRSEAILLQALNRVVKVYKRRGFKIHTAYMDVEFEPLRPAIIEFLLNTTAANKHVPELEQMIRLIQERVRAIFCTLPFKRMPARMLVEMVKFSVMWLNSFPAQNCISKKISPWQFLTGLTLDYNIHCRMPFRGYAHIHEDPTVTNDAKGPRTIGAICIAHQVNSQGTYKFLSLNTGVIIKRRKFTELSMPARVIRRVHYLGRKKKCLTASRFTIGPARC